MQTYTTPVYRKNKADITNNKDKSTTFFSPVKVQPKLTIGAVDDPYEREADDMADRVMRMPAPGMQLNFFKPAPPIIQRQENATKTLTEGAGVVKEQLEDKPGFEEWKDKQTDALKKKVWDDQSTELKAGIIGFGLSSAGILGTAFATNPRFRADTIKLLDDKNIALPLSLIPYNEYFPLSSFKYKLPSATGTPLSLSAEFEFKPYLDRMHEKWSFIPKTDLTLGVDTNYSKSGGFGFRGGSIKLKFGGGIFNFTGILNQSLPATPMLVSGNNPGESPMWIMRSIPGQFDEQLPKGYGVFFSVDVARLPELWTGEKRKPDIQRKCAHCEDEEKIQKKSEDDTSAGTEAPSIVHDVINSGGKPLDAVTRNFFEPRFGRDFSNIRIHTDSAAAKSTEQINALAYTVGDNIVFNQNQYAPDTDNGKRLLGHELTHVIQQNRNQVIYRKSYLDTENIADAQTVDSETKVKKVIYETLSEITSRLYPYIKDKIPVFKSKAVLHIDDPETFGYKFKKINNQQDLKDEDVHKSVQGFVNPKSQYQIYLNTRSKYCHAFHEAIHSISNLNTILAFFGIFLTEGLTQYFTDVIFLEQTGSKCKSHNYANQLSYASKFIDLNGEDTVAKLFFTQDLAQLNTVAKNFGLKDSSELMAFKSKRGIENFLQKKYKLPDFT